MVVLRSAIKAYKEAHTGKIPKSVADLAPYVTSAEGKAILQKILERDPSAK
jgi:hypothetical protein